MMIPSPFAIYMLFFSLTRRMCALCSLEYLLLIIIALLRIMPASIKSQRLPALCDNYPDSFLLFQAEDVGRERLNHRTSCVAVKNSYSRETPS